MLSVFDAWRGLTMEAIALRMLLAVVCGSVIGLERTVRHRPAGFRTHILICMGACITTLIGQFLVVYRNFDMDVSRLGAQVIAGVGFIGAGTIVVTRHQRVKGLTTAAGLWTAAIIGLALGAGFYEAGVITAVLVLMAETLFAWIERIILRQSPEINLYIRYDDSQTLERILALLRKNQVSILGMEVTRSKGEAAHKATAIFLLRQRKAMLRKKLTALLEDIEGVASVDVLSG